MPIYEMRIVRTTEYTCVVRAENIVVARAKAENCAVANIGNIARTRSTWNDLLRIWDDGDPGAPFTTREDNYE